MNPLQPIQIYQEADASFFVNLLDHETFLDNYEHKLKGEVLRELIEKDDKGQDVVRAIWVQVYPSKMNNYGVGSTISFLRTIADKMLAVTNLEADFIDKIIYQNIQDFTDRLCENYYEFGFRSIADLNEIDDVGRNFIIAQFNRSVNGNTLTAITAKTNINETREITNQNDQQQMMPRQGIQLPFPRIFPKV